MAKKDFSARTNPAINPAIQFLSTTGEQEQKKQAANAAEGQERKSKRINLLLQPSVLKDLSKVAHMRQTSVNDLINTTLKALTKAESGTIAKYNQIFIEDDNQL